MDFTKIKPFKNRVLIKCEAEIKSKFVAVEQILRRFHQYGEVKAVGNDVKKIKVGMVVAFEKPVHEIDNEDHSEKYVLVKEEQIVAVIK